MTTRMLGALCMLLVASSSGAEIVATGGGAVEIAPPASVVLDALESDTEIPVFDEQQGVTLGAPLAVNISAPGLYDEQADLTPGTIPAGTVINSHLVHFDIVFAGVAIGQTGTVTFRDRVLGIIINDGDVDASDGLGAPATVYPAAGLQFRGAELDENDAIEVGCDTLTLSLESFQVLDHVRVITAHEEPCDVEHHGEGCTPGYWKQCDSSNRSLARRRIEQFEAAGFSPTAKLNATFGTTFFPNVSLCDGANLTGGDVRRLARHGVAALLNAAHPDVDYPLTVEQVIAAVLAGDADTLAQFNELGCPLR